MFPGRPYTAPININTPFTTTIDIFEITAASNKPFLLVQFELSQTSELGDAQEEQLVLSLLRCDSDTTSGSVGSGTPTFRPCDPNTGAAGAVMEVGNTTQLTGGTSVEVARMGWNVRMDKPLITVPEVRWKFNAGQRCLLRLEFAPADAIASIVGWVGIIEL